MSVSEHSHLPGHRVRVFHGFGYRVELSLPGAHYPPVHFSAFPHGQSGAGKFAGILCEQIIVMNSHMNNFTCVFTRFVTHMKTNVFIHHDS